MLFVFVPRLFWCLFIWRGINDITNTRGHRLAGWVGWLTLLSLMFSFLFRCVFFGHSSPPSPSPRFFSVLCSIVGPYLPLLYPSPFTLFLSFYLSPSPFSPLYSPWLAKDHVTNAAFPTGGRSHGPPRYNIQIRPGSF